MMISPISFADFCCGIGGIRTAFQNQGVVCSFSNDNDKNCQKTYTDNFGNDNFVLCDIKILNTDTIPSFDILSAGFPCQPFSNCGIPTRRFFGKPSGLDDEEQGKIFFELMRILKNKKPKAFFLENVPNLMTIDEGNTFKIIRRNIESLGYSFYYKIITSDKLLPQTRKRLYMVGFNDSDYRFEFPQIQDIHPNINNILEKSIPDKYTISDHQWEYYKKHKQTNKERGNGFGYNLIDLETDTHTGTLTKHYHKGGFEIFLKQESKNPRMLTPRECARLQGFPDSFKITVSNTEAYKQFGNSVAIPIVELIAKQIVRTLQRGKIQAQPMVNVEIL
jgi:DNA (cytosine-5)-methyltransferase 1